MSHYDQTAKTLIKGNFKITYWGNTCDSPYGPGSETGHRSEWIVEDLSQGRYMFGKPEFGMVYPSIGITRYRNGRVFVVGRSTHVSQHNQSAAALRFKTALDVAIEALSHPEWRLEGSNLFPGVPYVQPEYSVRIR